MKTLRIIAAGLASIGAAVLLADEITGTIRISPTITHNGANAAADLTETISDVWKWAGTSATIGTQGLATALTKMYVAVSNNFPAGATNTLDLYGGLTDSFGNSFTPAKVKGFIFCPTNNMTVPPQSMLVRPDHSAGWRSWMDTTGSAVRVFSGGAFALFAPVTNAYTVTDATADTLTLINESTNQCGYKIYIFAE